MAKQVDMFIEWNLRFKNRALVPSISTGTLEDSLKKINVDNIYLWCN
jgi:hypothetical protein